MPKNQEKTQILTIRITERDKEIWEYLQESKNKSGAIKQLARTGLSKKDEKDQHLEVKRQLEAKINELRQTNAELNLSITHLLTEKNELIEEKNELINQKNTLTNERLAMQNTLNEEKSKVSYLENRT